MMSLNEPEKVNMNRTPQMQPQARQSFINYKDIPAASNSGLRMKKSNSRPNNNRCVLCIYSIPFTKKRTIILKFCDS